MLVFPPAEIAPEQSFLARSLRRPNLSGARAELLELLRTRPLSSISKPEANLVWSHHHFGPAEIAIVGRELYADILAFTSERGSFAGEGTAVEQIQSLLDVSSDAAIEARRGTVLEHYRKEFATAIAARIISTERWAALDEMATRLVLTVEERESVEAPIRSALISEQVDSLVEGGTFTPELAQSLATWSAHLRALPSDINDERRAELARLAEAWRLGNEDLPLVDVPVSLQRGEVCHATLPVLWFEIRATHRYSTSYGPILRVPVVSGLSFRVAAFRHTAINTDTLQLIDHGPLYVTNKRLIFDGEKKNSTIRLNAILKVTPHQNGIVLDKSSGRSPHLQLFGVDPLHAATILRRVIAEANA